jgi:hypothetical protein
VLEGFYTVCEWFTMIQRLADKLKIYVPNTKAKERLIMG